MVGFKHIKFNIKSQYPFEGKSKINMICGGTGITPMYQALHKIANTPGDSLQVRLLCGNKSPADILLSKELEALVEKAGGRVQVIHVVGTQRDQSEIPGWTGGECRRGWGGWGWESGWSGMRDCMLVPRVRGCVREIAQGECDGMTHYESIRAWVGGRGQGEKVLLSSCGGRPHDGLWGARPVRRHVSARCPACSLRACDSSRARALVGMLAPARACTHMHAGEGVCGCPLLSAG